MNARVITVSDRCHRGETVDTSGPAVAGAIGEILAAARVEVVVVPDEPEAIVAALRSAVEAGDALVCTAGGTGLAPRDRTPEATGSVIEREAPGLAEAMRSASAAITPHAWLSRGVCGVAGASLIVNLPGSRKGAVENLMAIAPLIPHALRQIAGDSDHAAADANR